MANQAYELAILLSLKDMASGRLDNVGAKLRAMGKDGRDALKTFEDLRKDVRQGLVMGGVGLAGLAMLKGGITSAASLEESLLDLRSAFQEVGQDGKVNAAIIGDQMNRAEHQAIDLGNKLQGTTQDYLQIFAALKKAGVDVETVLGGAGKAAGYLANVTGTIRTGNFVEQAKELGQFGKMFKLKPQEFEGSVNLFSALRDRFDIESGSLIESSKYFLGTASSLGQTGMAGASDIVKIFALLKRNAALEGSQAGTSMTSLFQQFIASKKELKELEKTTGIKLTLFDKKGQFAGWENMFSQAEKLRGLAQQPRLELLNKAFGEQGAKAFNAFVEAGVTGWRAIDEEANKAVQVTEKLSAQQQVYNAKMEALLGSLENLKATTFTPVLGQLKPLLDTANSVVGSLTGFAKAHPMIAGLTVDLFAAASVTTMFVGGFKALRGQFALWKIASAVAAGGPLPEFFRKTGDEAGGAGKKVGGLRGAMGRIPPGISTTVRIIGYELVIQQLFSLKQANDDYLQSLRDLKEVQAGGLRSYDQLQEALGKEGKPMPEQIEKSAAIGSWQAINLPKDLKFFLGGWRGFDQSKLYRDRAPELARPGVMAQILKLLEAGQLKGAENSREAIKSALEKAFPESFRTATQQLYELKEGARELVPELQGLIPQVQGVTTGARELVPELQMLKPEANRVTTAMMELSPEVDRASRAAGAFADFVALKTGGIDPLTGKPKGVVLDIPGMAIGGDVQRGGLVRLHSGERVLPARVTRGIQSGGAGVAVNGGIHLHVHPPAGSAMAEDPREFAKAALEHVTHAVRKQRERR